MRHDATFDKKQVTCPNSSTIGWSKRKCQVGNLFTYTEGAQERLGRMVARIQYAPALGDTPRIQGWILGAVLSTDLTHMCERWIDPALVTRVFEVGIQDAVVREFMGAGMPTTRIELVRGAISQCWSTLSAYLRWRKDAGLAS